MRLLLRGANHATATASATVSAKTLTSKRIDQPKVMCVILPPFCEQVVGDLLTVL
jgi:hypothetical protein